MNPLFKAPAIITKAAEQMKEKEHSFIRSRGETRYDEIIYCPKCGIISWNFSMSAEWNKNNLQNRIPIKCGLGEQANEA